MPDVVINHVMSNDLYSAIFSALLRYFRVYAPVGFTHQTSASPLANADIYHYHRPHLVHSLRAPSVLTVHHDLRSGSPLETDHFFQICHQADHIIALNQQQQRILEAQCSISHVTTIAHGYDHRLFRPKPKRRFEVNRPLCLAIMSKHYGSKVKGEAYLYALVKHLDPKSFSFLLVGASRYRDALMLRQLGFEVTVYEYLPYTLFPEAYKKADFLLILSQFEGGPASVPEAIASCTPMLTTAVGMAVDMVEHGKNGLFLSGHMAHDLALFHALAHNTEQLTDRLYQGAYECAGLAITWQENVLAHHRLYQQLLQRNATDDLDSDCHAS